MAGALSVVNRLEGLLLRWSDGLDPMLVRVVRQDLRSKLFVGVFSLLLLISTVSCVIIATAVDSTSASEDYAAGRTLFTVLAWIWAFTLVVVQASATHRLVLQERSDDTWDLVELTGQAPARMVRGLLLASLTQSTLYTAALAPFLVLAYLLRGIDLLTVGFVLIVVPMIGVAASAATLVLACSVSAKRAKAAGNAFVGLALLIAWLWFSAIGTFGMRHGISQLPTSLLAGDPEAWFATVLMINGWAWAVWMCLVLAASLLTHRADDRSSRPRRRILLLWINVWVWIALSAVVDGVLPTSPIAFADATAVTAVLMALAAVIIALFTVTEDWELTPRQARSIASSHGWRRMLAVITGPGAARGRWFALILAASAAAAGLLTMGVGTTTSHTRVAFVTGLILGYGLLLLWMGDLLARTLLGSWCSTPMARRLVTLVLAASVSLGPALLAMLAGESSTAFPVLRLICPPWAIGYFAQEYNESMSSVLLAMPIIAAIFLAIQARRMTVVTRRVTAVVDDRNPRAS